MKMVSAMCGMVVWVRCAGTSFILGDKAVIEAGRASRPWVPED